MLSFAGFAVLVRLLPTMNPRPFVAASIVLLIQARYQSALASGEGRDLLTDVLQQLILIRPGSQSIVFACALLQLRVKDVPIALEDVDELGFNLRKDVDPFDIRG